jgi:hypothetical protein
MISKLFVDDLLELFQARSHRLSSNFIYNRARIAFAAASTPASGNQRNHLFLKS